MKSFSRYILAASLTVLAAGASAQHTQSGYFLKNYTYSYQMNPAMGNDRNFVSLPAIGNVNFGINGNLHLTSVLYNVDGRTTTFLNPGVSVSEVMNNLHDMNRIGTSFNLGIMSAGFKAFGGYNTIGISARADIAMKVPRGIFSLMKEGIANQTYSINGLGAYANAYAEIALGHSRNITPEIRVGGALKFLVGAGNLNARFDRAELTLGTDDWTITTDAEIEASVKGLEYKVKENDHTGHSYVNDVSVDGTGINGFGMALDLGATYSPKVLSDWNFSLALLDLGFINWNNNMVASTNGEKTFNTDRYIFNVSDDAPNSFDKEGDRIRDDISALYELENNGDQGSRTTMLGATMNVGVEYTLPVYRRLTFGLLNTTRIQGDYSWTDFRLSANVNPVKCFSAGVNMGVGTWGVSFGWIANVSVPGFNFFVASDHTPGKLAKQGVPLSSNASLNLGMNIMF